MPHPGQHDRLPAYDSPKDEAAYGAMIGRLREFLDTLAGARPDGETMALLQSDLTDWTGRLQPHAIDEPRQPFGKLNDVAGRAQVMAPDLFIDESDDDSARGHVTFGRFYLGGNGAVHGGAIPLIFDEIMGRLANSAGRMPARTAFLHVDFRAVTPVGKKLTIRAWFESEEGRKRMLRGELRHGETLCAEAHGLFVKLNPGQP